MAAKKTSPKSLDESGRIWSWQTTKPGQPGVTGDVTLVFKTVDFDNSGFLAKDPPSNEASLFAREAIQNSWDAAREWAEACKLSGRPFDPFSLEFVFKEFTGFEKQKLVTALGLDEHRSQAELAKALGKGKSPLGLHDTSALINLRDSSVPLRVLYVHELSGLGMPGSYEKSESRMDQALIRVGYTEKRAGAGGAYGFGKGGLVSVSAIHVVIAYSCFDEVKNDPGTTRRLLGVTYWGTHKITRKSGEKTSFTGWAQLGERPFISDGQVSDEIVYPFVNDRADQVAAELGFSIRSPQVPGGTGTSFMILEPTIAASDLNAAIERYWWPAIMDNNSGLRIKIQNFDGEEIVPVVPKHDPEMSPFIRSFELANRAQDSIGEHEARFDLGTIALNPNDKRKLGFLGVVADPHDWSFPNEDGVSHRTLVALVRGPRMVVNYRTFRTITSPPHARGVFIADSSVDDFLRQTEDKAHTKWDVNSLDGNDPDAHKIAREINDRLRNLVEDFRKRFKTPTPRPGDINLPVLDELSRLMKGRRAQPPPPPEKRPIGIRFTTPAHAEPSSVERLVCKATVEFQVADWVWDVVDSSTVDVQIVLTISYLEDEHVGEPIGLQARISGTKFRVVDTTPGKFTCTGTLSKEDVVEIEATSDSYSSDWTVRFTPRAWVTDPYLGHTKAAGR